MEKKQLAAELDSILRLDTRPVGGIKLYKSQDDLPRKPFNFKLNLCQLVAMARYQKDEHRHAGQDDMCHGRSLRRTNRHS